MEEMNNEEMKQLIIMSISSESKKLRQESMKNWSIN